MWFDFEMNLYPWTYTQIHTPTAVQGGGGGLVESL